MKYLLNFLFVSCLFFSCGSDGERSTSKSLPSEQITPCFCATELNTNAPQRSAEQCAEARRESGFERDLVACYFSQIGFSGTQAAQYQSIPASGKYIISSEESKLAWQGAKYIGAKHNGLMLVKGGEIVFENSAPVSGYVEIDMRSIAVTDLEGEDKTKLEGHLHSADFFDTANHPTARFELQASDNLGSGLYGLFGTLTVKGISKEFKTQLWLSGQDGVLAGSGAMLMDRSQFDVRFDSNNFFENLGDKAIKNEVIIRLILKGTLTAV